MNSRRCDGVDVLSWTSWTIICQVRWIEPVEKSMGRVDSGNIFECKRIDHRIPKLSLVACDAGEERAEYDTIAQGLSEIVATACRMSEGPLRCPSPGVLNTLVHGESLPHHSNSESTFSGSHRGRRRRSRVSIRIHAFVPVGFLEPLETRHVSCTERFLFGL